jgi:hypothetical protein
MEAKRRPIEMGRHYRNQLNSASQNASGGNGGSGLGPLSADWFDDHARLDGLGADLHADNLPVDDSANLLNVRLERAGSDAGDLGANTTQVLGLAAMGDLIPKRGLLTGEIANAWHTNLKVSVPKSEPGNIGEISCRCKGVKRKYRMTDDQGAKS